MNNMLVTGGSGFIGSNFIRFIFEKTDFAGKIINLDSLTYAGNPDNLRDIAASHPDRYVFEHGDICNAEQLEEIYEKHQIDTICHFAAESHVDRSF